MPGSITDAVINNSNAVAVDGMAAAYSLTLNNSTITDSGSLTLGLSLSVHGTSDFALSGGTLSTPSIAGDNGDYVGITGYGTVDGGAVSGDLVIAASGGTLKFEGSVSGATYFGINRSATLELVDGTSQTIDIGGSDATLKLDAPSAFAGTILNLALSDTIDLAGITASSATYSGTTLTINETDGQQLTYNNINRQRRGRYRHGRERQRWRNRRLLDNAYFPGDRFLEQGTAGDWSAATDWNLGTPPTLNTPAVIDASGSYVVTITTATTAELLAVNAAGVDVQDETNGSLTLGGALTINGGSFSVIGGSLTASLIDVESAGHFNAEGTVSAPLDNDGGTVEALGNLTLSGAATGVGTFEINGNTLAFGNTVATGATVSFQSEAVRLCSPIRRISAPTSPDWSSAISSISSASLRTRSSSANIVASQLVVDVSSYASPLTFNIAGDLSSNNFFLASDSASFAELQLEPGAVVGHKQSRQFCMGRH